MILFSDNVGANKLHSVEFTDFCKEYPTVQIKLQKTGGIFHDRFIVIDYGKRIGNVIRAADLYDLYDRLYHISYRLCQNDFQK